MNDPWKDNNDNCEKIELNLENNLLQFEDNFDKVNFVEDNNFSFPNKNYLQSLENRLKKLKDNREILAELHQKREEAIQNLLLNDCVSYRDEILELEAPLGNSDAVNEIKRHICPVQPLNVGEIVHIVKYDQLEEEKSENEDSSETASR